MSPMATTLMSLSAGATRSWLMHRSFTPSQLSADAQKQQFGYNNDFIGFLPIDGRADHGLLVVNHEYTNGELMFAGHGRRREDLDSVSKDIVDVEMQAHGGTVLEIRRENGKWSIVPGSSFARRITAETDMRMTGPAAA